LTFYLEGETPRSLAAFATLKRICELYLSGHYQIEVVDLLRDPSLAKVDKIVAVPSLVRRSPAPVKLITGNLSDEAHLVRSLELTALLKDNKS